jgi:uncharacterized protein YmfQ (DUF2313 family)
MVIDQTDRYLLALQGLLPHGPAWPRDLDAPVTRMLSGLSAELARVDGRTGQLIAEAIPNAANDLLSDWERAVVLSAYSAVDGTTLSVDQRRANLVSKLTEQGGQSIAYFIALAAKLGFTITITEFHEWSVNDDVEAALNGTPWNYAWQVNALSITSSEWTVESDVETSFSMVWLNTLMESVFLEDKPAHTVLLFAYS